MPRTLPQPDPLVDGLESPRLLPRVGLVQMKRDIDRMLGELAAQYDASVHVQFWRHVAGQMVQALKKDDQFIRELSRLLARDIANEMKGGRCTCQKK